MQYSIVSFLTLASLLGCLSSISAFFTPQSPPFARPHHGRSFLQMNAGDKPKINLPFFAKQSASSTATATVTKEVSTPSSSKNPASSSSSLEEEVEGLVQAELTKMKAATKLKSANGVDYAPWMDITPEDEAQIRKVMKEKAEARRKRREQEKSVSGNLYLDSQAQELSGTGLKYKVIDSSSVELEWATKVETNTKGFIVKRRPAKTQDFDVIASYESWTPLASKGSDGGIYRYIDSNAAPGGWVYRITECDNYGTESDLCQCLVEVQTPDEQRAGLFAAVGIAVLAVGATVAGLLLDPYAG